MTYSNKAFDIVKQSINSAIFIDEKAKEFYSGTEVNNDVVEEKLSIELYNNFKREGISLTVHKFNVRDIEDENLKKYLLKDRDLVLLDWELDGSGGIEYSLKLLSEIVQYPRINFCCIYTSSPRVDSVLPHIRTYFSGYSKKDFENISTAYSFIESNKFLDPAKKTILEQSEEKANSFIEEQGINLTDFPIPNKSKIEALNLLVDAFDNFQKSENREIPITSISKMSDNIIINNTFIFILTKNVENDTKPSFLIKRISDELIKNKNSFIQLLGLEMQTIFNNNKSFINENMLQSSTEAFFTHRNYLKEKNKNDVPFNELIKKVLIEHATLRLRTSKLSLLDTKFLDEESKNYEQIPSDTEIASMNTFYNSVTVKSLNSNDFPNVNFGDIFVDSENNYYLCITALCDCLRPEKIKQNYFFVTGKELSIEVANLLGDSAFISYIPKNKAISWVNVESTKKNKKEGAVEEVKVPKKVLNMLSNVLSPEEVNKISEEISKELTGKEQRINDKNLEIDALKQFKYKPVYIQPHTFNIKNPKIENNMIELRRVESLKKVEGEKDNGDLNIFNVTYVTTLRPNYTQRIANHTFAHSVRVGVDFISKL
ncbi:MAG TPA: response regulator receiver domain [Bacteroidales bacterium]|nr:response regulator receiver domain [Bacteroidales bacterium]HOR81253.1 response regulator receiver domain [Bacteroidales bacterium]HPJ90520.1 response regulator receiver domain [Bacteroidales bacterium]